MKLKILIALIVALTLVACGGNAPAATTAATNEPSNNTNESGGGEAGDPAAVVQAYYEAQYGTEGDVAAYFCSTNQAVTDAMRDASEQMRTTNASTNTTYDVSGLTYETVSEEGDSAQVKVSGQMSMSVAGNEMPAVDLPEITHTLVNEGGSWKICG